METSEKTLGDPNCKTCGGSGVVQLGEIVSIDAPLFGGEEATCPDCFVRWNNGR